MPRILAPGQKVKGYTIEKLLNQGAKALAYSARDSDGNRVFFKTYIDPTPLTEWYHGYLEYQDEIRRRVETSSLKNFVVGPRATFEAPLSDHPTAGPVYIQVFELISNGKNLEAMLQDSTATLEQKVVWSKVILGSLAQLHRQKIVHTDLKPANLMLIANPDIKIGFRLKLLDIDFSILADKTAPWHGVDGYVGTPGYLSPEHVKGEVPTAASDCFTASLILHEVLAGAHPYPGAFRGELDRMMSQSAPVPRLKGPIPGGNGREVAETMFQMLSVNPAKRPTAQQLLDALNRSPRIPPPPTPDFESTSDEGTTGKLSLIFETFTISMNITTPFNHRTVRPIGNDATYWDRERQFTLERRKDGWYLLPNPDALNATFLNAERATEPSRLKPGDQIAVGSWTEDRFTPPARIEIGGGT